MAKFEILCEIKGLRHADIAVVLEHHHCKGSTWNHVSDDELCEHVEAKLHVSHSLDEADRN